MVSLSAVLPLPRFRVSGPLLWSVALLMIIGVSGAEASSEVFIGEALYMSGDLAGASVHLDRALEEDSTVSVRALYLLGRISLLTGDFRQSKEFFERSLELFPEGYRYKALVGIADALYGGGRYQEAVRRFREARLAGAPEGLVELKLALCELAGGKNEAALDRVEKALNFIPVLSSWKGREREFVRSLKLQSFHVSEAALENVYVLLGPVSAWKKLPPEIDEAVGPTPVKKIRENGKIYLRYGPMADPVEGMLLAESLRKLTSHEVRIIRK